MVYSNWLGACVTNKILLIYLTISTVHDCGQTQARISVLIQSALFWPVTASGIGIKHCTRFTRKLYHKKKNRSPAVFKFIVSWNWPWILRSWQKKEQTLLGAERQHPQHRAGWSYVPTQYCNLRWHFHLWKPQNLLNSATETLSNWENALKAQPVFFLWTGDHYLLWIYYIYSLRMLYVPHLCNS